MSEISFFQFNNASGSQQTVIPNVGHYFIFNQVQNVSLVLSKGIGFKEILLWPKMIEKGHFHWNMFIFHANTETIFFVKLHSNLQAQLNFSWFE